MCDQLRAFEVGCYGHQVVRTPHIDRLAGEGARFETAVSNNPLCMPARSVLLCGQYSRTCMGLLDNYRLLQPDGSRYGLPQWPQEGRPHMKDTTLPEALRDQGYHTAAIGKWHVHSKPADIGFEYNLIPRVYHRHAGQAFCENEGQEFEVPGFSPDWEVEQVGSWLRRQRGADRPFFLYYNISPPHMPLLDAPDRYLQMYDPADVQLRPNAVIDGEPAYDEEWLKTYRWDFQYHKQRLPHTLELPDGFGLRDLTALYYGMTTWVDDLVGQMLDHLAQSGLAEETIVVFTSDHGDMLGSHDLWNKARLLEESIRIPMLVRWPGRIRPACPSAQVASLIDLMPTLLELAGCDGPATMQGQSLADVLCGRNDTAGEDSAFIECLMEGIGIRTPTHLYGMAVHGETEKGGGPQRMFFDLRDDPYELRNLASSGEQGALAEQLRRRLEDWDKRTTWMR